MNPQQPNPLYQWVLGKSPIPYALYPTIAAFRGSSYGDDMAMLMTMPPKQMIAQLQANPGWVHDALELADTETAQLAILNGVPCGPLGWVYEHARTNAVRIWILNKEYETLTPANPQLDWTTFLTSTVYKERRMARASPRFLRDDPSCFGEIYLLNQFLMYNDALATPRKKEIHLQIDNYYSERTPLRVAALAKLLTIKDHPKTITFAVQMEYEDGKCVKELRQCVDVVPKEGYTLKLSSIWDEVSLEEMRRLMGDELYARFETVESPF